ncbi:hypothetical protein JW968_06295 [Candidatus Woesearchaeota archaeon]|nr:hypothetical protein [Candidatus Woesearchaeota archaeon]
MEAPEGYNHSIGYAELISYLSAADKIYRSGGLKWTTKVCSFCNVHGISYDDLGDIVSHAVRNGHLDNSEGLNGILLARQQRMSSAETTRLRRSEWI